MPFQQTKFLWFRVGHSRGRLQYYPDFELIDDPSPAESTRLRPSMAMVVGAIATTVGGAAAYMGMRRNTSNASDNAQDEEPELIDAPGRSWKESSGRS